MEIIYCGECGKMIPPGGLDEGKRYLKDGELLCPECYLQLPQDKHTGGTMVVSERLIEQLASMEPAQPDYSPKPKTSKLSIVPARRRRTTSGRLPAAQEPSNFPARDGGGAVWLLAVGVFGLAIGILVLALGRDGDGPAEVPGRRPAPVRPAPDPDPVQLPGNEQIRLAKLRAGFDLASTFRKENPREYAKTIKMFLKLQRGAAGTEWVGKVKQAIVEIRAARSKAADVAFEHVRSRAAKLAASGDYDGALDELKTVPQKLVKDLSARLIAERKSLEKQAKARLEPAIAAAERLAKEGRPQEALKELEKVKLIRFQELREKLMRLRKRLNDEKLDVAGQADKRRRAAAAKHYQALLSGFDQRMLEGKYAAAAEGLRTGRAGIDKEVLALMPAGVDEAGKIAGLLALWQSRRETAVKKLVGSKQELKTRSGEVVAGTVVKVAVDALSMRVTRKLRGAEMTTVQTVKFAELAPRELAKLAPAFKLERPSPDGHMALAMVALVGKDVATAEKSLAAAGKHPLAARWGKHLDVLRLGEQEAAAKGAWEQDIAKLVRQKYSNAQGKALLAALEKYSKAYGETAFAGDKKKEIAALKTAAHLPLGYRVYTKFPFDAAEAKRRQKETAEALGIPVQKIVDLGGGIKLRLMLIPAGDFIMGAEWGIMELMRRGPGATRLVRSRWPTEGPRHKVRLTKPYYLGKFEVKQTQWQKVMGKNPAKVKDLKCPVDQLSWNDCQAFVGKLNARFKGSMTFRLPTEAEWEYACRSGSRTYFWFGDKITTDQANYNGEFAWDGYKGRKREGLTPPLSFKPNAWGLHDMAGNVWEWCQDRFGNYQNSDQTDPRGPEKGGYRIMRGGSWSSPPDTCRSTHRHRCFQKEGAPWPHGMRVLLEVSPSKPGPSPTPQPVPAAGSSGWLFGPTEAKRRQEKAAKALRLTVKRSLDLGAGVKLDLVLIPAGEFMMGAKCKAAEAERRGPGMPGWAKGKCLREHPRHKVRLTKPYYLGKTEVTQAQWERVMGSNPSSFKDPRNPVEMVSWDECQKFVKKLNALWKRWRFRLPSEAEWEYACRAGTATSFHFGEKITSDQANYNGEYIWDDYKGQKRDKTSPVGSFKPNAWGLYDMAGNVWEWCQDVYGQYPGEEQRTDPKGPSSYPNCVRMLRGGSWFDPPCACRSAYRGCFIPSMRKNIYGLRILVETPSR